MSVANMTSPSRMIVFTVLFTLPGRDPEENKYVEMAHMMFYSFRLSGQGDRFYLMADDLTWAAFKAHDLSGARDVIRVTIPRPQSLLEGIAYRYSFFNRVPEFSTNDTYLFVDCDMLNVRKFVLDLPADTIAVLPEGGREDPNYCGEGAWARLDHAGLSAGFWAIRPGPDMLALMDEISASIRREPTKFYCEDQPHFNRAITKDTRCVMFDPSIVSFNGHGFSSKTLFINCAGCPGDADFHYDKMLKMSSALWPKVEMR